jgi:PAS domain S-box-containing protein
LPSRSTWLRYGGALLPVAAALLITLIVPQVRWGSPFLFFFPAVILAAVYGGTGPGIFAVVASTLAVAVWVLPTPGFRSITDTELVQITAFVIVASAITIFNSALRRSQSRLHSSEERFQVAQELSLDAFTILEAVRDTKGKIVDFRWQYANPTAARILKSDRKQLTGSSLLQVLPGNKTNSELFDRYVQVVETGEPHDIEIAYEADNIHGWFRNMAVKLEDGVAVSFYDITNRKRYETELSYQAFLLENVSDAVFAITPDLKITLWNRGAEALYGWKAAEVMGRPVAEIVRTAATSEERQERLAAVDAGDKTNFEAIHCNRQGDTLYVDSVATPVRGNDGTVTGYVVINRDMTARKRYEHELLMLNESLEQRVEARTAELERSNRDLDQFAYVASHDLKAPLRAISLLAHWITEDATPVLPPASLQHLAKLNSRARRMENLLDDLLTYSRAGRIRQEPEIVDTRLLVQEIVDFLNLPEGFTVKPGDSLPTLLTERVPLESVLRNLIQNACKHHDHPQSGEVTISAQELDDSVLFEVADNGPGIAPEYHARIFQLFQTLRPRDEVEGSGIGLAVVKKTVESRGGAIQIKSLPGAGTTFRFTWPHARTFLPPSA